MFDRKGKFGVKSHPKTFMIIKFKLLGNESRIYTRLTIVLVTVLVIHQSQSYQTCEEISLHKTMHIYSLSTTYKNYKKYKCMMSKSCVLPLRLPESIPNTLRGNDESRLSAKLLLYR